MKIRMDLSLGLQRKTDIYEAKFVLLFGLKRCISGQKETHGEHGSK